MNTRVFMVKKELEFKCEFSVKHTACKEIGHSKLMIAVIGYPII
jgi:hypothetical protein